ncbi:MAG TPA: ROK family protein [Bacillales bacterium]|nr:ROK family protein [Bacillales bacterium]
MLYGAIEAGGTKFVCAVGNDHQKVIQKITFPTSTPEETFRQVFEFFDAFSLKAIGVGSFGPIDVNSDSPTYGYIKNTPKTAWQNIDFLGPIKNRYEIPVGWTTDVNAAALGEATKGAGKGLANVLYLTIGTGIGGGAIINGEILEGFGHPEMGHIKVEIHPNDQFEGLCPFHDHCLEGMASGPTIEARLSKKGYEIDEDNNVWGLLSDYIAQALYHYTVVLCPQIIILGGGVMKNPSLLPKIKNDLLEKLGDYVKPPSIENYLAKPGLGDDAGVVGGLILAEKTYKGIDSNERRYRFLL